MTLASTFHFLFILTSTIKCSYCLNTLLIFRYYQLCKLSISLDIYVGRFLFLFLFPSFNVEIYPQISHKRYGTNTTIYINASFKIQYDKILRSALFHIWHFLQLFCVLKRTKSRPPVKLCVVVIIFELFTSDLFNY